MTAQESPVKKAPVQNARPDKIRSIAFADDTLDTLTRLCQTAHDLNGRQMSHSRVIRALIRFADSQSPQWMQDVLLPVIEEEIVAGIQWGHESPTKKSFVD
jgi:hypothetical protein